MFLQHAISLNFIILIDEAKFNLLQFHCEQHVKFT